MNENTMYANQMSISISQNDCCITFDTVIPKRAAHDKTSEIAETKNIIMSVAIAKKLDSMLQVQFKNYETAFGPIQDLNAKAAGSPLKGLKGGQGNSGKK